MRAGPLRHRVTVQRLVETPDGYGQLVQSWVTLGTVAADMKQLSGRELANADQMKAIGTIRFTLRYVGSLFPDNGVITTMRLIHEGRIYNILDVDDVGRRHRTYLILAQSLPPGDVLLRRSENDMATRSTNSPTRGLFEARGALFKLARTFAKDVVKPALDEALVPVRRRVIAEAPRRTGALAGSVEIRTHPPRGGVVRAEVMVGMAGVGYAAHQEFGTKRMPEDAYLERAFDATAAAAMAQVERAVARALAGR